MHFLHVDCTRVIQAEYADLSCRPCGGNCFEGSKEASGIPEDKHPFISVYAPQ